MSFQFNSDREQIRGVDSTIIGSSSVRIRAGQGTEEREIFQAKVDTTSGLPRVGINRTGRRIDFINVTSPGLGYTDTPTVNISAPTLPGGIQAVASATTDSLGRITSIGIDNQGDGYEFAPTVTITGGNGSGATAEAALDIIEFELDVNGAIRTSTSIISDTANILNLDIDNLVTPDIKIRAPHLKTFMNGGGQAFPTAPEPVNKDDYFYVGSNVYQALNNGVSGSIPPFHDDGIELNGTVQFKHIGYRIEGNPDVFGFDNQSDAGVFPRSITPLLGDRSDKIATTEYVLNLATNDVGGRIYVSEQIGDDDNDGRSPVNPVRTIKKACQLAWQTPGVKESIIIAGGEYIEDNPISIPPDASVVGDNLRLVIIRPNNVGKHIFKFGDKNYVIGVTYQDKVNSSGASVGTWDFAMVFDDKQRITYDAAANGDFGTNFPVGHQFFGPESFEAKFAFNGGLASLTPGIELFGVSTGTLGTIGQVTFDITDTNNPLVYQSGSVSELVRVSGSGFQSAETFLFGGTGTTFWQATTAYDVGDVVFATGVDGQGGLIGNVYTVTTAGVSDTSQPDHTAGQDTNGTVVFEYTRAAYSVNFSEIESTRAEGEVVFVGEDQDSILPIVRVDFSLEGTFDDGFQSDIYGSAEDLGGVVFYTNPLEGANNIHDFKEGDEIEITGMPSAPDDLTFLNGKQRIYKVIEDADGRARRFVIPKKVPPSFGLSLVDNWNPDDFGAVVSVKYASKSVTLSLLNSPNKFPVAAPVARRYQDACLQIRNNIKFISDEVVGRVNDQFKKEYFSVYNIDVTDPAAPTFEVFAGPSRFAHTYVSGGTITVTGTGNTYNVTDFQYDQNTGVAVITTGTNPGLVEDDTIQLAGLVVECNIDGVLTQKTYPSFNIPISDEKCKRDIGHFLNALIQDLEFGSNYNIIKAAQKYFDVGQIEYVDYEIIQTVRAIEYARELAIYAMRKWRTGTGAPGQTVYVPQYASQDDQYIDPTVIDDVASPACANVYNAIQTLSYLYVDVLANNASGTYLDAAYLIARNRDHIADEAYLRTKQQYQSLALNNVDERKCRRDINYILSGVLRDLVLGGNYGAVNAAELYYTGTALTGVPSSELGPTRFAFQKVRDLSIQAMRNWKTAAGNSVNPLYTIIPQFTDNTILVDANGTPTAQLTPTDATYNPANGDFVMTFAAPHGVTTNESIRLEIESFVFKCAMDNYRSEHYLPESDQPAATTLLPVTSVTSNTITVNVGASGPDVSFTPTNATYDPATGNFTMEIGTHTLSLGEGIVLDDNSFTFACAMDGYDAQKTYPRPGIDPFAGRSMKIIGSTDTSITVNVGASAPNKYFTPTAATYDPTTGDMTVTVGQHGLGVGRGVVLEDNSFTFTCLTDPNDPKTYPRPGQDPFAGKSIAITAVGHTTHSPSNANYDPANGILDITLPNHGFNQGDYIKIDDNAITFTCDLDGNATQHTYPRSYEYASGRWFEIDVPDINTIRISGLPIPRDTSTHTYVSFVANSLQRQDGTFTINVGSSSDTSAHTFVSATANAIKHEPQSAHTFISATSGAVKHLPQSAHQFQRVIGTNVVAAYPAGGSAPCADVEASLSTSFALIDGILEFAADPDSATAIQPGTTTRTTGTLYTGDDIINYPVNVLKDANNNFVTIRSVYDDLPIISASPYTQNSSIISKLGGSGALIDGSKVKSPNCPFPGLSDGRATFPNQGKSMVASAFTIVSEQNGIGYKVIEDGYTQLVSVFCIFTVDGILCESGGYASVTNSASNFGQFALRSTGIRREPYEFDAGYTDSQGYQRAFIDVVNESITGFTELTIDNLGRIPLEHYVVRVDGFESFDLDDEYFIDKVEVLREGPPFRARVTITDGSGAGLINLRNKSTGLSAAPSDLSQAQVALHRPSICNSSSHTWEFVGSGVDYNALPENGGIKIDANEQVSENYGRTYVSGTDELGDFKVGTFAKIENRTGNITFTGTVSISEVEFLKLRGGDVVVTGFDNSNTLGGTLSSDSKLPTQKAVRDYIINNLGQYLNKNYSTNPVPRALVELTDSGLISESQLPASSPIEVYTVADEAGRLALEGIRAGDIAIQDGEAYILNTDSESLFIGINVDSSLQFTPNDIFTGSNTGGKIQLTEYREGVVKRIIIADGDGGSGYSTSNPPTVVITDTGTTLGHVPASAEAVVAGGEIVAINIVESNGYKGGKGYADVPTISFTNTFGGSGAQATAEIESRLYGDIVNAIKINATDTIESSDVPAETVNVIRTVNTSGSNDANWVSLSTSSVPADRITDGPIPTGILADNSTEANSNTALFGDQSYKKVVKSVRGSETRYFITTIDASGSDYLVFLSTSQNNTGLLLIGHQVGGVTGIQPGTTITQIADITVGTDTYKRVTLSDGLTSAVPTGSVVEFTRPASPILLESTSRTAGFIESVQIENGGQDFAQDEGGTFNYNNIEIQGGTGTILQKMQLNFRIESGVVTNVTVAQGGLGYEADFTITDIPTEIGTEGSGLILRAKVNTTDKQEGDIGIDVARVTSDTLSDEDFGTVGVARFKKSQFDIGDNGSVTLLTGRDSGLDADLLDGNDSAYYRNADNINGGRLKPAYLSGEYNISITQQSGSTAKLTAKTGSLTGDGDPNEIIDGITADVRRNDANQLFDPATKEVDGVIVSTATDYNTVLSFRGGGSGTTNPYGGVGQIAFTDANNFYARGSSARVDSEAQWSAWAKIWTSQNDYSTDPANSADIAGPNAYRLRNRTGLWYQNANTFIFGDLSDRRLPSYQTQKDFNTRVRVLEDTGSGLRYDVYISNVTAATINAFDNAPFTSNPPLVKILDEFGNDPGEIRVSNIEVYNIDGTVVANRTAPGLDYSSLYAIVTGTLEVGGNFTNGVALGDNTVQIPFSDYCISGYDGNADGMPDGNVEVVRLESTAGEGKVIIGRADGAQGSATSPAIWFRSSDTVPGDTSNYYTVKMTATGGDANAGSGALDIEVATPDSLTVGSNIIWNEGNVVFNTDNVSSTTNAQNQITVKSAVFRDENGDFAANVITADLTGTASGNLDIDGGTLQGNLEIGTTGSPKDLTVRGNTLMDGTAKVDGDFTVDYANNLIFADVSEAKVGIGTASFPSDEPTAKLVVQGAASQSTSFLVTGGGANIGSALKLQHQGGGSTTGTAGTWNIAFGANELDFGTSSNNVGATGGMYLYHKDGSTTNVPLILETQHVIVPFRLGIGDKDPGFGIDVNDDARISTALTIGKTDNNNGAPIYFLGATGAANAGGGYLSNFRVGNQIIDNDIFEITANDGPTGPTDWKATPALAIQGTNNRVAINTTAFGGTDPEEVDENDNPIQRDYQLNIQGDVNFNGTLFQNNAEFVTSRWTEATNELDIYRLSRVGINKVDPTYTLEVSPSYDGDSNLLLDGSVNISGTTIGPGGYNTSVLHANGDPIYLDSYGVIKSHRSTISEDVTIPANQNATSTGTIVINTGSTVTISAGSSWTIV